MSILTTFFKALLLSEDNVRVVIEQVILIGYQIRPFYNERRFRDELLKRGAEVLAAKKDKKRKRSSDAGSCGSVKTACDALIGRIAWEALTQFTRDITNFIRDNFPSVVFVDRGFSRKNKNYI